MLAPFLRLILVALACGAVACNSGREAPADGPPPALDAGPRPDAAVDASVDATPLDAAQDNDHDGHPAYADCNDDDPSVWRDLPYAFRDADGDGHTVAEAGTICSGDSLPAGYATVGGAADCDDTDPAAFTTLTGFADSDADGSGAGLAMTFCTAGALPAGFVASAGDCAPDDATRWVDRAYSFRDADGDGAAVIEVGVVCSGAALPPGYLTSAPSGRPLDCNDGDPAVAVPLTVFVDADHDGFGAGPSQAACTSGAPPPGFSTVDTDCDDGNLTIWQQLVYTAVDRDGDHVTAPELGTRCTAGTLLPPFFAAPHGDDCDDSNAAISIALTVFADHDLDGFGAGPSQLACTNGAPALGFATNGTDCNDDDASLTHLVVLYPDQDGDGVGTSPRQVVCVGTALPAGLVRGGYDEDDADPAVIETDDFDDLLALLLD